MAVNVPRLHGPNDGSKGLQKFHRREGEKHEPEREGIFPVREGRDLQPESAGWVF